MTSWLLNVYEAPDSVFVFTSHQTGAPTWRKKLFLWPAASNFTGAKITAGMNFTFIS